MEEVQIPLSRCEEGMFSFPLSTFGFITSSMAQSPSLSHSFLPLLSLPTGYAGVFQGTQSKRMKPTSYGTVGITEY